MNFLFYLIFPLGIFGIIFFALVYIKSLKENKKLKKDS